MKLVAQSLRAPSELGGPGVREIEAANPRKHRESRPLTGLPPPPAHPLALNILQTLQ